MTLPAPIGPLTKGEHVIADKLIACSWFGKFTKEDNEPAQRGRIHFDKIAFDADAEGFPLIKLDVVRPFVCIWPVMPAGRFAWKPGTDTPAVGIDYGLYFEADQDDAKLDDPAIEATQQNEIYRWWLNMIGALLYGDPNEGAGIKGLICQPNFALTRISALDVWQVSHQEGMGEFLASYCILETGTRET